MKTRTRLLISLAMEYAPKELFLERFDKENLLEMLSRFGVAADGSKEELYEKLKAVSRGE